MKRILTAAAAVAVAAAVSANHAAAFHHASPLARAVPPSTRRTDTAEVFSRWGGIAVQRGCPSPHRRLARRPASRRRSSAAAADTDDDSSTDDDTDDTTVDDDDTGDTPSRRIHGHTLAVLTLPRSSADRVANEAILETAMSRTSRRLSVVLRCSSYRPSISQLRAYVGEIYTSAWDITLGFDDAHHEVSGQLLDVIVYPQNLPNAAPEKWIQRRPDLDCVCSHDTITGWSSVGSGGTGVGYSDIDGDGLGGLEAHVDAINADRKARGLGEVTALTVDPWPVGADVTGDDHVVFMDDSAEENDKRWEGGKDDSSAAENENGGGGGAAVADASVLFGGPRVRDRSLYDSVCVGGTFDGMHYGHRKLLTLAASSVQPNSGKLLVGITRDEMLTQKAYPELIPRLDERIRGVRDFVDNLAPGLKNRVKIVPIDDAYGPPGADPAENTYEGVKNDFDALVLSHETLPTGKKLNDHRVDDLGLDPLMLLCTRRTEPHGMSSTALRRMRKGVRPEANMI